MPTMKRACLVLAVIAVAACHSPTDPTPTTVSVTVTGMVGPIGRANQFTARATLSNGTVQDVTATAIWTSSNPAVATVTSDGLLTMLQAGAAEIDATYQGVIGKRLVSIDFD